jgi:hypothetical protein
MTERGHEYVHRKPTCEHRTTRKKPTATFALRFNSDDKRSSDLVIRNGNNYLSVGNSLQVVPSIFKI